MQLSFFPSFLTCYDPCFQTQLKSCCDEFRHLCFTSCLSLLSVALPLFRVTLSPTVCASVSVGEHHQHELPEALPNSQVDQAAETGLHHSYSAMDLCTVIQGEMFYNLCLLFITHWNFCLYHNFWPSVFFLSPPTGSSLRLSSHRYAFLHICYNWNAGILSLIVTLNIIW